MEQQDELREHVIATAVESIPRSFLEDFRKRAEITYEDTYQEIAHDRTILSEHRLPKLRQLRPFRMDFELAEAAQRAGLSCTAKTLAENDWNYAYAVMGNFGLTQAYVQTIGALPQPAKYRDTLANAARIPRLPLDDPAEIYQPRTFYGLLAHNPLGSRFTEEHQKLGSLQLCVPFTEMKGWALEISVAELIACYPAATKKPSASRRAPAWRQGVKKGTGDAS